MADDKKTAAAKKKAAGDETQLLPIIIRYFKLAGLALSVYIFGYTQFSPSWILLGLVVYVWKEKHTQRKHLRIKIQQQLAKDEESTILARVEDLPSWVSKLYLSQRKASWSGDAAFCFHHRVGRAAGHHYSYRCSPGQDEYDMVMTLPLKLWRKGHRHIPSELGLHLCLLDMLALMINDWPLIAACLRVC